MKFTAIYNNVWQSGSHWHTATHFKRVQQHGRETVTDMLTRHKIDEATIFLFHGWPLLQGDTEEDMITESH